MELMLWILIVIVYVIVKMARAVGKSRVQGTQRRDVPKSNVRGTQQGNVPRKNTPVRPQQRSFAAMPDQQRAVPNVERNCSADDKHRYENNLSPHKQKQISAVPNVQRTNMQPQPKKSGNRKAAMQLYIGDPVPKGMRKVVCSYCAAENIVPYAARNEYKCYFCHYDI